MEEKNLISAYVPSRQDMSLHWIDSEDTVRSEYEKYLTDESRYGEGRARIIFFPDSEEQISSFLRRMCSESIPVTVSAGRTGVVGGAVPPGGAILSTEKMNRILGLRFDSATGEWLVRVQPGVILRDLHTKIERKAFRELLISASESEKKDLERFLEDPQRYFYPPDPTEDSSTIGGNIATNAAGSRTYKYGSTRRYVRRLRVALVNGDVLDIRRSQLFAGPRRTFEIQLSDGGHATVKLPSYPMPNVKNVAGYYVEEGMDLIDLFIGSEGTIGVVTEAELALAPRIGNLLTALIFFPSERDAIGFAHRVRGDHPEGRTYPEGPESIEYFDSNSLNLLRLRRKESTTHLEIPEFPEEAVATILLEQSYMEGEFEKFIEALDVSLRENGSSLEDTMSTTQDSDRKRLTNIRHALPETVNRTIASRKRQIPEIHKVGTDTAVPDQYLDAMLDYYVKRLVEERFEYVIFGHISENNLHVNLLPNTLEELKRAERLAEEFARWAVEHGGTVSGEHGVGKLKRNLLKLMYGERGVEEMFQVKKTLDPQLILNPGNIFQTDGKRLWHAH
jgi:D-lactate dehydrogenase (cytochrome)